MENVAAQVALQSQRENEAECHCAGRAHCQEDRTGQLNVIRLGEESATHSGLPSPHKDRWTHAFIVNSERGPSPPPAGPLCSRTALSLGLVAGSRGCRALVSTGSGPGLCSSGPHSPLERRERKEVRRERRKKEDSS